MCRNQADLFKVLGVDSRLKIIELLKEKGALCVNEMSEACGISPSAVSQHLKVLKYAGLVRNERKGYWIPYKVNTEALEKCGRFLSQVCACGCEVKTNMQDGELKRATDDLELLKKYEQELKAELNKVKERIEELKTRE